eukprot:Rhum_TRINITY_DN14706_c7_g1::Rhum_TRINITY_DN14706_c7_g1_i1::g.111945::m.111945
MAQQLENVYHTYDHENVFEDSPSYMILKPRHDPADGQLKPFTDFERIYSVENGYAPGTAKSAWDSAKERHPPLLEGSHRMGHGKAINLDQELKRKHPKFYVESNSSPTRNDCLSCLSWLALPLCGPCIFAKCVKQFEVPTGHVQPLEDGEGGYMLGGQGVHSHCAPFWRVTGEAPFNYSEGVLSHGDWCLVVIDQGFIGLAMDKGQPVLLPPGFHQWKSTTLRFERVIDMNESVIFLGPY